MENKILSAACSDKLAYEKIIAHSANDSISDKGNIVLTAIGEYYDADPDCSRVDKAILIDRLGRKYPKHAELFEAIVSSFEDVSIPNIVTEVLTLKRKAVKEELAAACVADKDDNVIQDLYEKLESLRMQEDHAHASLLYQAISAKEVVDKTTGQNLIKLLPGDLNRAIGGGVLRKQHIVAFARPDVGKTTFAINLAKGFLKQGLSVLYCGNEDPAHHIIKRMMSLMTGMTAQEIEHNPERADELLQKRNWDKFIFAEMSPGTPAEIKELVEEFQPDVLLVDQARNLDMREANRVLQLEKACQFVRNISKKHDMVGVSFVQAGDSAENKLVLGMGDVDFSNTGIPATADLMVGLGCNTEYEQLGRRMLSFPKNKINGNKEPVMVPVEFNTFKMG